MKTNLERQNIMRVKVKVIHVFTMLNAHDHDDYFFLHTVASQ